MVARVLLIALAFWGVVGLVAYAVLKYGLPEYYAWKERKAELELERERARRERTEMLVDEAEDEYPGGTEAGRAAESDEE